MTLRAAAAAAFGTLLLAGCAGTPQPDPSDASSSPSPTATPTATASATPSPSATASASPSPAAPAATVVTSANGTLVGSVPVDWQPCEDAESRISSSARDVLGAWGTGGSCDADVVTVASFESPDSSLTAERYYEDVFAPSAEGSGLELDHSIIRVDTGYEVLLVEARASAGFAAGDEATFIVFAGPVVVVGALVDTSSATRTQVDQLRAVAESIEIR